MSIWPIIDAPCRKIGYARVSTKDQKLRMQRDGLEAVGCDLIFEDHGFSGKLANRPGLDALLQEMRPGDTVVVFKLDRLGRSVLHLADLLVRFQREDIHFCSITDGINTTTAGGKFVYHLFSAVSELQRDIIVENTLIGLEAARRRGKKLGRRPKVCAETVRAAYSIIHKKKISIAEAARRFGIPRTTLQRAFRREGLPIPFPLNQLEISHDQSDLRPNAG